MPDSRKHRGPHPDDPELFGEASLPSLPSLQRAVADLSWLLGRGYAATAAVTLVGDRYQLRARQRTAVQRAACSDAALARRRGGEQASVAGSLLIDGYNVLTTVEAALAGGVILHARDGCFRDMASMHGTYRKVEESITSAELIAQELIEMKVERAVWLLDKPVSNSGLLRTLLLDTAQRVKTRGAAAEWSVELVADPDPILMQASEPVATSDSRVLDAGVSWFNLARRVVEHRVPAAWIVECTQQCTEQ